MNCWRFHCKARKHEPVRPLTKAATKVLNKMTTTWPNGHICIYVMVLCFDQAATPTMTDMLVEIVKTGTSQLSTSDRSRVAKTRPRITLCNLQLITTQNCMRFRPSKTETLWRQQVTSCRSGSVEAFTRGRP